MSDAVATRGPMNGSIANIASERDPWFSTILKIEGLGTPLPAGTVRVYGQDSSSGALQLLGEDGVGHTPKGQEVQFTLGRDFDVTVVREQTGISKSALNASPFLRIA